MTGMMSKLQSQHPERRDELIELLGIDPEWRMNRVSDGQVRGWVGGSVFWGSVGGSMWGGERNARGAAGLGHPSP